MYTTNGNDVLEFNLNFKVTKKLKTGFMGLRSTTEDFVILDNGDDERIFISIKSDDIIEERLLVSVKGRMESGTMTALLGAR